MHIIDRKMLWPMFSRPKGWGTGDCSTTLIELLKWVVFMQILHAWWSISFEVELMLEIIWWLQINYAKPLSKFCNKTKHNKTKCLFSGIYLTSAIWPHADMGTNYLLLYVCVHTYFLLKSDNLSCYNRAGYLRFNPTAFVKEKERKKKEAALKQWVS